MQKKIEDYRATAKMTDGTEVLFEGIAYGCRVLDWCNRMPCSSADIAFEGNVTVGNRVYKGVEIGGGMMPLALYPDQTETVSYLTGILVQKLEKDEQKICKF